MTNLTKKLATAIATGALLTQMAAPAVFAETTLVISDNGAGSDNTVAVTQTSTTTVNQTNDADIDNDVDAKANTGKNDANFNTGGSTVIDTGNAEVNAHVSNDLNTNVAEVENCNCASDLDVLVEGNGAFSDNTVATTNTSTVTVNQDNDADVDNDVDAEANTGKNEAGYNTGDGDVVILTGNATVNASVLTAANTNWARVGSGNGDNGHVSLRILDNGAGSDNTIATTLASTTNLNQENDADIDNDVDAKANTGKNDANFNTGDGYVVIDTGNATVNASIDNDVNFNAADVDCGCVFDLLAKIHGNGASVPYGYDSDTENTIAATLAHTQYLTQDNDADLDNDSDGKANTGKNEASKNTAGGDSDPAIFTGDSETNTSVENSGNTNVIGDLSWPDFELPDFDFQWSWDAVWWGFFHQS